MIRLQDHEHRPRLLVSVRNAEESQAAIAGGADVIDVKEPARGSLGAADADVVAAVVEAVANRVPVSVACGELLEWDSSLSCLRGVAFAKLGLAGCGNAADWPTHWRDATSQLPVEVRPVAVVYADWQAASAPPPQVVLSAAIAVGCPALLVDTWNKRGGSLFDHWSPAEVVSYCELVRHGGMATVLAGSLAGDNIVLAADCGASLVAVRGAVCTGGRTGPLSAERVRQVRRALDSIADRSESRSGKGSQLQKRASSFAS